MDLSVVVMNLRNSQWNGSSLTKLQVRYIHVPSEKPNAPYKLKNLLKKTDESNSDPNIALLEYRNPPIDGLNQG